MPDTPNDTNPQADDDPAALGAELIATPLDTGYLLHCLEAISC